MVLQKRAYFDGDETFSQPDIDPEYTEAEWKLFRRLIFRKYRDSSLQTVLSCLTGSDGISTASPNLAKVATILEVLPVTTATVERSFSSMKLIKTRLRSRMGEKTLDHAMRICIEGPDRLSDDTLEPVVDNYKEVKQRKLALWFKFRLTLTFQVSLNILKATAEPTGSIETLFISIYSNLKLFNYTQFWFHVKLK